MDDQDTKNGNRHIMGRSVWIPSKLPQDMVDFARETRDKFFNEVRGESLEKAEERAKIFLSPFTARDDMPKEWELWKQTVQDMIDSGLELMRTAAILDELQPYIEAELKRPEYDGFSTLHDMIEAYHNAEPGGGYIERMYHRAMYNSQLALELHKLKPYIDTELKNPKYSGKDIDTLWSEATREEDTIVFIRWEIEKGSLFEQLLTAAREASHTEESAVSLLFSSEYLPALNSPILNDLMRLSKRDFEPDERENRAFYEVQDHTFIIDKWNEIQGGFSVSAKKILNTALLFLTNNNYYKSDHVNPTVIIPLIDYGEACGYKLRPQTMTTPEEQGGENKKVQERVKELKKAIRRDLHDISSVVWSAKVKRGNGAGDYVELRIISSHSIRDGLIIINFDIETATYLNKSYLAQFPLALLKIDNRNPNAYSIGYAAAVHNSIDNNHAKGTNTTLSVKSLLRDAPQIPTIGELDSYGTGQRNWKDKIKKPLEKSLNTLIDIGWWSRWEYRERRTGETYTPETADSLLWEQYEKLLVDFAITQEPDQKERREKRAAEKQLAVEAKKARKKRPKKRERGGVDGTQGGC